MFYMCVEDQTQVIRLEPRAHLSDESQHSPRHDILETVIVYIHAHMIDERCTHRVCAHRKQVKYRVGLKYMVDLKLEHEPRLLLCIMYAY